MSSAVCGREARRPAFASLSVALVVVVLVAFPRSALAEPVVVVDGIPGTNGAPVPTLVWAACPAATLEEAELLKDYQCTTADVPLSYRDPRGHSVKLALGRLPAADPKHRLGMLFWNPGGPGGSGRIPPAFSQRLHERFDIVGFDPRGVAASTPLRCFATNQEALELFGRPFPITRAQERAVIGATRQGTRRCAENGGPMLEHMATANVARDLDLLRQAVGDQQLSYLGFSYGTHLGEVYANLFPDQVRALSLDAVVDPVQWTTARSPRRALAPLFLRLGSHEGAYDALLGFLRACEEDPRCAFREQRRDLLAKYDTLLERVRRRPVQIILADGQPLTITYQVAVEGTLLYLYDPIFSAELAGVLQEIHLAAERSGQPVAGRLELARPRALVRPQYGAPRSTDEFYLGCEQPLGVFCADSDSSSDPWVWPRYARAADRVAPYFGPGAMSRCRARRGRPGMPTVTRGLGTAPQPIPSCWSATFTATRRLRIRTPSRPRASSRTRACSRSTRCSGTVRSCRASASSARSSATSSTSSSHRGPSANPTAGPSIPSLNRDATAGCCKRH
jgi:pimeloyl-ACP methyl ester carboxylesterase